jgi:hypothetical protein
VGDGRLRRRSRFANYMAGSLATTAGGHGGTLVSGTHQAEQESLLTHPPRQ